MREIRPSGSEGGGPDLKAGPPTPMELDIAGVGPDSKLLEVAKIGRRWIQRGGAEGHRGPRRKDNGPCISHLSWS